MPIVRLAAGLPRRRRPVSSTLGLAGGMVQVQRAGSALRFHLQVQQAGSKYNCLSSSRCGVRPVRALRAG